MASAIIFATRSTTEDQPNMRRLVEKAAQTFLLGVPVMVEAASGGVIEWDGTTVATGIAGFSKEAASQLITTGVPKTLTYGTVPNQSLAVNIPAGAPINDGRIGVETAIGSSIFHGQVGPSQTTAVTDVGKQYGMTKDTDGHWFVDKTKSTVGTNTVVTVVKVDNQSPIIGAVPADPRGVQFVVTSGAAQPVH